MHAELLLNDVAQSAQPTAYFSLPSQQVQTDRGKTMYRLIRPYITPRKSKVDLPTNEQTSYVRISEISDKICWFKNFGPQCEYVKYERISTQARVLTYPLCTCTTTSIILLYYAYGLLLFQHYITIWATFWVCVCVCVCMHTFIRVCECIYIYIYTHIVLKYWTLCII